MERKALFIINPISGGKKKDGVPELIHKHLDGGGPHIPIILYSDGVNHARQIAKEAANKFDLIVAVGGDGTINEIASSLVGTDTTLGIIPFGSGNGLSRFLNIPMDTEGAIKSLISGHTELIDTGTLNDKPFFNMAGMGFDAHIAEVFSHGKKRGFITYIKSSIREVSKYKTQVYDLTIDGKPYQSEAFMLSFANSSQYGNNAHIAPQASVQDGLLDICVIKKFPLWKFIELSIRMITKTTDSTRYVEIIKGKHIHIRREGEGPVHLDGEPRIAAADIKIKVIPNSLRVIVGSGYQKH